MIPAWRGSTATVAMQPSALSASLWSSWFDSSFLSRQSAIATRTHPRSLLTGTINACKNHSGKNGPQSFAYALPTVFGLRPGSLRSNLASIAPLTPPRVLAAVLRTACNGWCTAHRFQRRGGCILGCSDALDKIEHYAVCPHFANLCQRHLQLQRPPPDSRLAFFVGLGFDRHPSPTFSWPSSSPQGALLAVRAIASYALYRVHNACRFQLGTGSEAREAFPAYVQDAVQGHAAARGLLRSAHPLLRED